MRKTLNIFALAVQKFVFLPIQRRADMWAAIAVHKDFALVLNGKQVSVAKSEFSATAFLWQLRQRAQ